MSDSQYTKNTVIPRFMWYVAMDMFVRLCVAIDNRIIG